VLVGSVDHCVRETLTPTAYARTKIDSVMFSTTEPLEMFKSAEIADREGDEMEDATGLEEIQLVSRGGLKGPTS
jgi:hypothetical protein